LELGLGLNRGFLQANNLDCGRASRQRKGFVVRADEKLTGFMELESMIRDSQRLAPAIG
jgi:hypothetical protein